MTRRRSASKSSSAAKLRKRPYDWRYPKGYRVRQEGLRQWGKRAGLPDDVGFRVSMDLAEIWTVSRILDRIITRLSTDQSLSLADQGGILTSLETQLYSVLEDYMKRLKRPLARARKRVYEDVPDPTLEDVERWARNQRRRLRRHMTPGMKKWLAEARPSPQ
jgi:hypothetical protein